MTEAIADRDIVKVWEDVSRNKLVAQLRDGRRIEIDVTAEVIRKMAQAERCLPCK